MAGGIRSSPRDLWRAKLAEPGLPNDSLPHSVYEVPWFYLADRNGIPAAEDGCRRPKYPTRMKHGAIRWAHRQRITRSEVSPENHGTRRSENHL